MAPRVSWAVATQADRRQTRINDKNTFRFTFTPLTRLRDRPHKIELWFHPSSGRETGRTKLNYGFTRHAAARPAAHRWNISQDFRYTILADVHFTSSIIHRSGNFELIIFNTQLAFFVGALSSPLQGAVSPCPENPKPGSCAFSMSFTDTPPDPTPSSVRFRCFIALPPPRRRRQGSDPPYPAPEHWPGRMAPGQHQPAAQTGHSHPIPKGGIGGSPRFAARSSVVSVCQEITSPIAGWHSCFVTGPKPGYATIQILRAVWSTPAPKSRLRWRLNSMHYGLWGGNEHFHNAN